MLFILFQFRPQKLICNFYLGAYNPTPAAHMSSLISFVVNSEVNTNSNTWSLPTPELLDSEESSRLRFRKDSFDIPLRRKTLYRPMERKPDTHCQYVNIWGEWLRSRYPLYLRLAGYTLKFIDSPLSGRRWGWGIKAIRNGNWNGPSEVIHIRLPVGTRRIFHILRTFVWLTNSEISCLGTRTMVSGWGYLLIIQIPIWIPFNKYLFERINFAHSANICQFSLSLHVLFS